MIKISKGDRFGRLVAIDAAPPSQKHKNRRMWYCQCDCGNVVALPATYIARGVITSCGCKKKEPRVDYAGRRYGKLVALKATGVVRGGSAVWVWLCDCGKKVEATADSVLYGGRVSCGCEKKRTQLENVVKAQKSVPRVSGSNLATISSSKIYASNSSGVRGVHWHKHNSKWCAVIGFRGKRIVIGYFDNIAAAAESRRKAEDLLYGGLLEQYAEQYPERYADFLRSHVVGANDTE